MQISSAAGDSFAARYALEAAARDRAKAKAQAFKADVSADAAEVRASPRFEAQETRKGQARAKLQQIREWLKIVRKLYAQNPKGMAKALAQVFKDLKAALKDYKDAGGQESGMAGGVADAMLPPASQAPSGEGEAGTSDQTADPASETASGTPDKEEPRSTSADGAALYDAVVTEVRKMIGEDGLEFIKEVRGIVDDTVKLLDTARGQAAIRRRDKDTDKAFEDVDKALKELREALHDAEQSIRTDAPTAGMTLSVAA